MVIYKITNKINGKVYIGKTIRNIQDRFQRHIQDATSGRLDTHLARAIRKYGQSNFEVSLVEEVQEESNLSDREKYWIEQFNSFNDGYNETRGGDGGNTYEAKTSEEMAIIKDRIRETKLGALNPQARPVKCFNVETKEELHFGSSAEARDYFGETNHNFVTRRCKHKTNYLFRGLWNIAYEEDDYNPNYSNEKSIRTRTHNKVIDMLTGEEKIFSTYANAERYFGLKPKSISGKAYLKGEEFIIKNRYKITVLN